MQRYASQLVQYAGAVDNNEFEFKPSQAPAHRISSGFSQGRYPLQRFIICADREAGFFQVKAQECCGLQFFNKRSVRCGQFLFFIIYSIRTVAKRTVISVLFLSEYTTESFDTISDREYVLALACW